MKRWAAVLVMSAVWHQGALALGLGEIEVGSRLNQKFDAAHHPGRGQGRGSGEHPGAAGR